MGVREDREVRAPPAKALAALATAGENLGYAVQDVRARPALLLMTSPLTWRGASLGFIVTAHARRHATGCHLSLDVTPMLGFWARKSADTALDDLLREFQLVLGAPRARIRRPERRARSGRPFARLPRGLAAVWALLSVTFFGLAAGGWWWLPASAGLAGATLLVFPSTDPWWDRAVVVLALASLPFGVLGMLARRLSRAGRLWRQTVQT